MVGKIDKGKFSTFGQVIDKKVKTGTAKADIPGKIQLKPVKRNEPPPEEKNTQIKEDTLKKPGRSRRDLENEVDPQKAWNIKLKKAEVKKAEVKEEPKLPQVKLRKTAAEQKKVDDDYDAMNMKLKSSSKVKADFSKFTLFGYQLRHWKTTCPESCEDFKKYWCCVHVDASSLRDFMHVDCADYKKDKKCIHLSEMILKHKTMSIQPSDDELKMYMHTTCTEEEKHGCQHIRNIFTRVVTVFSLYKRLQETCTLRLQTKDFVHNGCQEYDKQKECDDLNSLIVRCLITGVLPTKAQLEQYEHTRCSESIKFGCSHLKKYFSEVMAQAKTFDDGDQDIIKIVFDFSKRKMQVAVRGYSSSEFRSTVSNAKDATNLMKRMIKLCVTNGFLPSIEQLKEIQHTSCDEEDNKACSHLKDLFMTVLTKIDGVKIDNSTMIDVVFDKSKLSVARIKRTQTQRSKIDEDYSAMSARLKTAPRTKSDFSKFSYYGYQLKHWLTSCPEKCDYFKKYWCCVHVDASSLNDFVHNNCSDYERDKKCNHLSKMILRQKRMNLEPKENDIMLFTHTSCEEENKQGCKHIRNIFSRVVAAFSMYRRLQDASSIELQTRNFVHLGCHEFTETEDCDDLNNLVVHCLITGQQPTKSLLEEYEHTECHESIKRGCSHLKKYFIQMLAKAKTYDDDDDGVVNVVFDFAKNRTRVMIKGYTPSDIQSTNCKSIEDSSNRIKLLIKNCLISGTLPTDEQLQELQHTSCNEEKQKGCSHLKYLFMRILSKTEGLTYDSSSKIDITIGSKKEKQSKLITATRNLNPVEQQMLDEDYKAMHGKLKSTSKAKIDFSKFSLFGYQLRHWPTSCSKKCNDFKIHSCCIHVDGSSVGDYIHVDCPEFEAKGKCNHLHKLIIRFKNETIEPTEEEFEEFEHKECDEEEKCGCNHIREIFIRIGGAQSLSNKLKQKCSVRVSIKDFVHVGCHTFEEHQECTDLNDLVVRCLTDDTQPTEEELKHFEHISCDETEKNGCIHLKKFFIKVLTHGKTYEDDSEDDIVKTSIDAKRKAIKVSVLYYPTDFRKISSKGIANTVDSAEALSSLIKESIMEGALPTEEKLQKFEHNFCNEENQINCSHLKRLFMSILYQTQDLKIDDESQIKIIFKIPTDDKSDFREEAVDQTQSINIVVDTTALEEYELVGDAPDLKTLISTCVMTRKMPSKAVLKAFFHTNCNEKDPKGCNHLEAIFSTVLSQLESTTAALNNQSLSIQLSGENDESHFDLHLEMDGTYLNNFVPIKVATGLNSVISECILQRRCPSEEELNNFEHTGCNESKTRGCSHLKKVFAAILPQANEIIVNGSSAPKVASDYDQKQVEDKQIEIKLELSGFSLEDFKHVGGGSDLNTLISNCVVTEESPTQAQMHSLSHSKCDADEKEGCSHIQDFFLALRSQAKAMKNGKTANIHLNVGKISEGTSESKRHLKIKVAVDGFTLDDFEPISKINEMMALVSRCVFKRSQPTEKELNGFNHTDCDGANARGCSHLRKIFEVIEKQSQHIPDEGDVELDIKSGGDKREDIDLEVDPFVLEQFKAVKTGNEFPVLLKKTIQDNKIPIKEELMGLKHQSCNEEEKIGCKHVEDVLAAARNSLKATLKGKQKISIKKVSNGFAVQSETLGKKEAAKEEKEILIKDKPESGNITDVVVDQLITEQFKFPENDDMDLSTFLEQSINENKQPAVEELKSVVHSSCCEQDNRGCSHLKDMFDAVNATAKSSSNKTKSSIRIKKVPSGFTVKSDIPTGEKDSEKGKGIFIDDKPDFFIPVDIDLSILKQLDMLERGKELSSLVENCTREGFVQAEKELGKIEHLQSITAKDKVIGILSAVNAMVKPTIDKRKAKIRIEPALNGIAVKLDIMDDKNEAKEENEVIVKSEPDLDIPKKTRKINVSPLLPKLGLQLPKKSSENLEAKIRRKVDDFCPYYCEMFDKYGSCNHIDDVSFNDFKHKDCNDATGSEKCDHLSKVMEEVIERMNMPETERSPTFDLTAFEYIDADKDNNKDDKLAELVLTAMNRVENQSDDDVTKILENVCETNCEDFTETGTCNHVDKVPLSGFKHIGCKKYKKNGKCKHLKQDLDEVTNSEKDMSMRALQDWFSEYDHVDCDDIEKGNECMHLPQLAMRGIARKNKDKRPKKKMKRKKKLDKKVDDTDIIPEMEKEDGTAVPDIEDQKNEATKRKTLVSLKGLEDKALRRRIERKVDDFCPKYCIEFDKRGTCSHVDEITVDDFDHSNCIEFKEKEKCDHLKEKIDDMIDLNVQITDKEVEKQLEDFTHKVCDERKEDGSCNHPKEYALTAIARKEYIKSTKGSKENEAPDKLDCNDSLKIEEAKDNAVRKENRQRALAQEKQEEKERVLMKNRKVDDFCPMYCKTFDKYGTCHHVDDISASDIKHVGCKIEAKKGSCNHFNHLVEDAVQKDPLVETDKIKKDLKEYVHLNCNQEEESKLCDHLAEILRAAASRKLKLKLKGEPRCIDKICPKYCNDFGDLRICPHLDHFELSNYKDVRNDNTKDSSNLRYKICITVNAEKIFNRKELDTILGDYKHTKSEENDLIKQAMTALSRKMSESDRRTDEFCPMYCVLFQRCGSCPHVDPVDFNNFTLTDNDKSDIQEQLAEFIDCEEQPTEEKLLNIASKYEHIECATFKRNGKCNHLLKLLVMACDRLKSFKYFGKSVVVSLRCPEKCKDFEKLFTCKHVDVINSDSFEHNCSSYRKEGECNHFRESVQQAITSDKPLTRPELEEMLTEYQHKACEMCLNNKGVCFHAVRIVLKAIARQFSAKGFGGDHKVDEFCPVQCKLFGSCGTCEHVDIVSVPDFRHDNCNFYSKTGQCDHLSETLDQIVNSPKKISEHAIANKLKCFQLNGRSDESYIDNEPSAVKEVSEELLKMIPLGASRKAKESIIGKPKVIDEVCEKDCKDFDCVYSCQHVDGVSMEDFKHPYCEVAAKNGNCDHVRETMAHIVGSDEPLTRKHLEDCLRDFEHIDDGKKGTKDTDEKGYKLVGLAMRGISRRFQERKITDRNVDDFCPKYCETFDKYGTCTHVDEIVVSDFEHRDCKEQTDNGHCDHLNETMAGIHKIPKEALKDLAKSYSHDCENKEHKNDCDHLEDLLKTAMSRKTNKSHERKKKSRKERCSKECSDFRKISICRHLDGISLDNFLHSECKKYGCDHLRNFVKNIVNSAKLYTRKDIEAMLESYQHRNCDYSKTGGRCKHLSKLILRAISRKDSNSVDDTCPMECPDFHHYGCCTHIDDMSLDDFQHSDCGKSEPQRACDHLKEEATDFIKQKLPLNVYEVSRQFEKYDHTECIESTQKEKCKHLPKLLLTAAERKAKSIHRRNDRRVDEFCPIYCEIFDKYGTCSHIDQVQLTEFKKPGSDMQKSLRKIKDTILDITLNDPKRNKTDFTDELNKFDHIDCQDAQKSGYCDHLTDLITTAAGRIFVSKRRNESESKVSECPEMCSLFQKIKSCSHVDSITLNDFKHSKCLIYEEDRKCDHLEETLEAISSFDVPLNRSELDIFLSEFQHRYCKEFIKSGVCNHLTQLVLKIARRRLLDKDRQTESEVCPFQCEDFSTYYTCIHIDRYNLDEFKVSSKHTAENKASAVVKRIMSSKEAVTEEYLRKNLSILTHHNCPDGENGECDHLIMLIVRALLRKTKLLGQLVVSGIVTARSCSDSCAEFYRYGCCSHIDGKSISSFDLNELLQSSSEQKDLNLTLEEVINSISSIDREVTDKKLNRREDIEEKSALRYISLLKLIIKSKFRKMKKLETWTLSITRMDEACEQYCEDFHKIGTCCHVDGVSLNEFEISTSEDSDKTSVSARQVFKEVLKSQDRLNEKMLEEKFKFFSLINGEEARKKKRNLDLVKIAIKARSRIMVCQTGCQVYRLNGSCRHTDDILLSKFAHSTCSEYKTFGYCSHLRLLFLTANLRSYSQRSQNAITRLANDYVHLNCPIYKKRGSCQHIVKILRLAMKRNGESDISDSNSYQLSGYDEWSHDGCKDYSNDQLCSHMTELSQDNFQHNCSQARQHGWCSHAYDVIAKWRPTFDGYEYLRRTDPQTYDAFYHPDCEDFSNFGTCIHIDELQCQYFEHDGCDEYAENGSCPHLKELLTDGVEAGLKTDTDVEAYYHKKLASSRASFSHQECTDFAKNGTCCHLLDMLREWRWKYTSKMQVANKDYQPYKKYYHDECNDYVKNNYCSHTVDTTFDSYKHLNCEEYTSKGRCNHFRDSILRWRAKYRMDYNLGIRSRWYLLRRYRFYSSGTNVRRPIRFERSYVTPDLKKWAKRDTSGNDMFDRMKRSFGVLYNRMGRLTDQYQEKIKATTDEMLSNADRIRQARMKMKHLLNKQDSMRESYRSLDSTIRTYK